SNRPTPGDVTASRRKPTHRNKRKGSAVSIEATPASFARPGSASALLPMKLQRGSQSMILLYGFPPPWVRVALQRSGLLVGPVAPKAALPGSLEQYDYLFVGSAGERTILFERAVRDCMRSGWSPVEAQQVFSQRSAAAPAVGKGSSR